MKRLLVIIVSLVVSFVFLLGSFPAEAGPVRGGVLRLNTFGDPPSYDCMSATTSNLQTHVVMVFSGLIRTNPMEEKITEDNLMPCLAEKWEQSPDGKTYTFYLRKGVKWHDGKPFTAKDAVYSLNKFRDPKRSAFAKNVTTIDKVEQVDDYTVRVHLKAVDPLFLFLILPPYFSVQPEHLKDVDNKSTDFLVGTGPFKFKEYIPGKKVSYVRNPDYFMEGLPYLDGAEVYFIKQGAMANAFIGGEIDVCGNLRSFFDSSIPDVKKVKALAPEAVIMHKTGGSRPGIFFSFVHKGPWHDVRVRKAMAMVLDLNAAVVAKAGGPELGDDPGFGIVPDDLPGAFSMAEVAKLIGAEGPMEDRIAKAKKLMAEAGYAQGFNASITTREEQWRGNLSLYCADMWKRHLNINVALKQIETTQWVAVRKTGEFDMAMDALTATTNLAAVEYLGIFQSLGALNYGQWENQEYTDVVKQIWTEQDPVKKDKLIRKAQEIFYEILPFFTILGTATGCAWRPDLMTGWPAKKGIVMQKTKTTQSIIDHLWLAGTEDAKRWMK